MKCREEKQGQYWATAVGTWDSFPPVPLEKLVELELLLRRTKGRNICWTLGPTGGGSLLRCEFSKAEKKESWCVWHFHIHRKCPCCRWSVVRWHRGHLEMTQGTPVCLQHLPSWHLTPVVLLPPVTTSPSVSRFLFTLPHPLAGSLTHHAPYWHPPNCLCLFHPMPLTCLHHCTKCTGLTLSVMFLPPPRDFLNAGTRYFLVLGT